MTRARRAERIFKMFDPNNPRIADLDLSNSKYLGGGSFGTVYEVFPGFVMKTGDVDIREVEQQDYLHSQGLALPVLDYTDNAILTYKAESVGEIPEEMEDDYWDFREWIEQEWYYNALSHLDDHDGNWGVWKDKKTGISQFVWLDCDPDWTCEKCDMCGLASYDLEYIDELGECICEVCLETLPRCDECDNPMPHENAVGLCEDCIPVCDDCDEKLELDNDDYWVCPVCDAPQNACVNCENAIDENALQCAHCQKTQSFLPGIVWDKYIKPIN